MQNKLKKLKQTEVAKELQILNIYKYDLQFKKVIRTITHTHLLNDLGSNTIEYELYIYIYGPITHGYQIIAKTKVLFIYFSFVFCPFVIVILICT